MKKQDKKARSSAFQKFLKRVEDLGSAYANGTQSVKQVRQRYNAALNELEEQANDMAVKARKALNLKQTNEAKKAKAANEQQQTSKKKDKKVSAKRADKSKKADKKDKKSKDGKAAKSGKNNKSGKGAKASKAKASAPKKADNKKKKSGKAKKSKAATGGSSHAPAIPLPRKKVVADFVAETRASKGGAPATKDDLRVVTGIGAAIETKLNEAGIYTLQHLANASVPRLKSILNEAGAYYRRFDPQSWPRQAKQLSSSGGGRLN